MDIKEEKILKFLQNRCSPAESEEVIGFLKHTNSDDEIRRILGSVWQKSNMKIKNGAVNLDGVLDTIHHRINKSEASVPVRNFIPYQLKKIFYNAAAILFLPLLITAIWSISKNKDVESLKGKATWIELVTPIGSKMNFELPDGSLVWLNDGSKIKYPSSFSGQTREVHLEGEAFFNISKNEKVPFVVNNKNAAIRVTGTSFNVRAYPGDQVFETTLNTGIIELDIPGGKTGVQKIAMKPGEQISVDLKSGQIDKKYVNAEEFNAWINGKLLFRDTPLDEVVLRLERWYNADIRLSSPELHNILITATFQEEKLTQALELLSYATPIKYSVSPRKRKEDGTYTKQLITISKR